MAATHMLRKRQRELEAMKTPAAQARRALELEAAKRAEADYVAKYPRGTLTPETFDAADDYRTERHDYWKSKLGILN